MKPQKYVFWLCDHKCSPTILHKTWFRLPYVTKQRVEKHGTF